MRCAVEPAPPIEFPSARHSAFHHQSTYDSTPSRGLQACGARQHNSPRREDSISSCGLKLCDTAAAHVGCEPDDNHGSYAE
jgi:hypothetical protein